MALNMIRNNEIDIAVAGGVDCPIIKNILAGFCATRIVSIKSNDEPEKSSRPFDKGRDGVILSEGAGILILEELKHALDRKVSIYGEICGYGRTSDAYNSFMPSPDQVQFIRAINFALTESNLENDKVDYICAWGLSRDIPDINETKAIKKIFGKRAYKIPISAVTSMIGQPLGATGAINCVASLLALKEQLLPPTINQEQKDPECDLDYVPNISRKAKINNFLLYSFVFGGRNSALVVKKI